MRIRIIQFSKIINYQPNLIELCIIYTKLTAKKTRKNENNQLHKKKKENVVNRKRAAESVKI